MSGRAAMNQEHVQVAVLCVTHRSAALLPDFAAALVLADSGVSSRIVIVDSGSFDDTLAVAADVLPHADICRLPTNRGFAAGINEGLRHIRATGGADSVLIVNPDVRPAPGCLVELYKVLEDHDVGIAVPLLRNEHAELLNSIRRAPGVVSAWAEAIIGGPASARLGGPTEVIRDPAIYRASADVAWATGGMLLVSERAQRIVGEWDESYFLYEEEVDFCLRVLDAGFLVRFTPNAEAMRIIGPGPVADWALALMALNRVRHMRRRPGGAVRAPLIRSALVAGNLLRRARGRRDTRAVLWALISPKATPRAVMQRFKPESAADVRAN